jgi:transposase
VKKCEELSARERMRKLIEAHSRELLYLPPYSPDLNPIEEAFPKIEATILRQTAPARRSGRPWTEPSPPPQTPEGSASTAVAVCRANISDVRNTLVAVPDEETPT